jgi:hypothetical protein
MKKTLTTLLLVAGLTMSLFTSKSFAQGECKGSLIVNEISNGVSGTKEFVELVAASCGACGDFVDISRWVIDDNNGIFTSNPAVAASNLGISSGHLRLKEDSLFQNFPVGHLLVLFNVQDYDSTNADFVNADGVDFYDNGNGAIFIAVGSSSIVERTTTTPIVGTSSSANYCGGSYAAPIATAWTTVGIRNSSLGDGIQTRCPGCNSAGEPTFYHGVSYGDTTMHVIGDPDFIDGAHVEFPIGDTLAGSGRAFDFFQGSEPGVDSNWRFIPAASATPGAANSLANSDYIADLIDETISYNCCPADTVVVVPPDTTFGEGILIVTELSNGPSGNCEYVELLVAACGGSDADTVDIRGWIIDDNSGNFNTSGGCTSGVSISNGHLRLAANSTWEKVAVGSILVLFNGGDNCFNFVDDGSDNNNDNIYFLNVGSNANVERTGTSPSSSDCDYCGVTYGSTTWNTAMAFGNTGDAAQVRCPGDCAASPDVLEPAFYHGVSYGSAFTSIAATATSIGGAKSTGSGSGGKFEFFQGTNPGSGTNWRRLAATSASTAGVVFSAFRDSVIAGVLNFPCCGTTGEGARMSNSLGANEVAQGEVRFYPNPAGNELFISINETSEFEVKLIDLMGRVVYQQKYPATQGTSTIKLDVTNLAEGMYIYSVATSGNEGTTGKLMIKK